ncbi:MAG: B12-binding domain-containing radical SAM protein [Candidatus Hodarchaeota archaeon]
MKIRFIFPKWQKLLEANPELEDILPGYYFGDFNMPGLAMETVASLTPLDIEIMLTDDHLENIDFNEQVDLVAITAFTPQAKRAYKIADLFRERHISVVIGGIHSTLMPEEAGKHADHVIIGHADRVWQEFLKDFRQGKAKKFYKREVNNSFCFPLPRRDLFKKKGYFLNAVVLVSRGCKYNCPACIIPYVDGKKIHLRPIEEIVKEVMHLKVENIYIADETPFFMGHEFRKFGKDLFTALIPFEKKLFVNAVRIMSLTDEELKLAYQAGIKEVYLVFAYPPFTLSLMNENIKEKIANALKRIHDNGLEIFASFGLGFDYDDESIFEKSLEFARKTKCDLVEFFIATPFPRTPFWKKLKEEGRLLHENWELYNSANVVFKPKRIKVEELYFGYIQCWKEFYNKFTFDDFGMRFSRYWGMNRDELKLIYNKKKEIKKKDFLKDT